MKRFFMPLLMALVLTGCSTYQYTSRTIPIGKEAVTPTETSAELVVDYEKSITATSDFQKTANEAIQQAHYRCMIENKVDVVVDPVYKVERSGYQMSTPYKATVTAFAGTYKTAPTGVDVVKDYSMEEVEKYKLLTDPDFAKYYYSKGTGDSYNIYRSSTSVKQKLEQTSLAIAPKMKEKSVKQYDIFKSKKLRNAGIGLTITGVVTTLAIALPCKVAANNSYSNNSYYDDYYYDNYYGYNSYYSDSYSSYNYAANDAGNTFLAIGISSIVAGLPMWAIGSARIKKCNRNVKVSAGGTQNGGVGVRLNF